MMTNKYRNIRAGIFDSKKEMKRFKQLESLEKQGVIKDLRRQVRYDLLPSQYIDGKCVERGVKYFADFVYIQDGKTIVEDVKSPISRTKDYIIKRKMMLHIHGIRITEI